MTAPSGAVRGAVALLERSITYMLGSLALVRPDGLDQDTPCGDWDLRTLLAHVEDALMALVEAVSDRRISRSVPITLHAVRSLPIATSGQSVIAEIVDPCGSAEVDADLIAGVRTAGRRVIEGWSAPGAGAAVTVGGIELSAAIVAAAGGIEIATHGWDIARATGWRRPVPTTLAEEMLDLLPMLVPEGSRRHRYAAAVAVPANACAGDKLIAQLGRRPPDPVERRYLQSRAALLLTAR